MTSPLAVGRPVPDLVHDAAAGERLVMYSCRTRGFYPSCHAEPVEEWREWIRLGGEVRPDNRLAAAGAGRFYLCEPLSGAPCCP